MQTWNRGSETGGPEQVEGFEEVKSKKKVSLHPPCPPGLRGGLRVEVWRGSPNRRRGLKVPLVKFSMSLLFWCLMLVMLDWWWCCLMLLVDAGGSVWSCMVVLLSLVIRLSLECVRLSLWRPLTHASYLCLGLLLGLIYA